MLIVIFMTWLKLTFLKAWQIAVVAVVCALFIGLSWPYAITQSRNEISEWLGNQKLMLDTSVILTLEVIWQMAYCMLSAKLFYDGKVKKRTVWVYRMLRFFPGILILPVLFYLQIQVMYLLSGIDFATISWSLAALVLLAVIGGSYALRWLLPQKSLRLELLFLSSALVLILGIVCTVNGSTNFKGSDPIEWKALLAFLGLAAVCGGIGIAPFPNPFPARGKGVDSISNQDVNKNKN